MSTTRLTYLIPWSCYITSAVLLLASSGEAATGHHRPTPGPSRVQQIKLNSFCRYFTKSLHTWNALYYIYISVSSAYRDYIILDSRCLAALCVNNSRCLPLWLWRTCVRYELWNERLRVFLSDPSSLLLRWSQQLQPRRIRLLHPTIVRHLSFSF